MSLTEFLLARIAEDEGLHYDPDRALAEREAKRLILEEHAVRRAPSASTGVLAEWCQADEWGMPCPTLRAIALPYANHPDYLQEWKP